MPDARLLLEACGAPARSRLAALLCEIKDEDPLAPVTVVVPTSYAAVLLRRRLGEARGLFNVRFLVFERLAEYLGAPLLAQQGKQPSSPLLELAVLHRLTAAASGAPAFAELAQHTSVLGALRDACHALDRLPPAALQQLAAVDALRAQLVHWYMQFRDCLRHHYRPEALARAAAAAVADGTAAGVLRDLGQVIVYLPADLSPGQLALVQALGRAGRCTVLAGLVGEEGPDAPVRQSVAALTPVLGPAQPPAVPPAPIWPQHLLCAPDAYEEVRWVVRFLVQQAESGVPFSRMAVFYRQPSPYAELLAQQLGLAGIPVAGPSPLPARDTPAGRLLLQLLDALATGWRREAVLRWLSECPVAEAPGVPLTAATVACWERLSRQAGIVGGLGQWQQRLHALRHRQHELAAARSGRPWSGYWPWCSGWLPVPHPRRAAPGARMRPGPRGCCAAGPAIRRAGRRSTATASTACSACCRRWPALTSSLPAPSLPRFAPCSRRRWPSRWDVLGRPGPGFWWRRWPWRRGWTLRWPVLWGWPKAPFRRRRKKTLCCRTGCGCALACRLSPPAACWRGTASAASILPLWRPPATGWPLTRALIRCASGRSIQRRGCSKPLPACTGAP
ncbi:MAG: hypothetical protein KatS3mg131_3467 [Candidatus Tectimicrobiota bacterium]|nr:MAG: hypothetical protein KatS3mg131_3467 [Candidatus Tectomicrobia bacterium]